MTIARAHGATRKVVAVLLALAAYGPVTLRAAEGGSSPQLILRLVAAVAAVQAVRGLPLTEAFGGPGGKRGVVGLIPSQIGIPDAYADAEHDFIDLDHDMSKVNTDRIVWLDLMKRRRAGWMMSFAYDEEVRGPVADTDDVVRFVLEYRF